ncbi:MAG: hypothetical protein MUF83_10150 [Acidimicrobiales bacterium]|nr:hypothetical protein [Acidimicrobiales bacterium]
MSVTAPARSGRSVTDPDPSSRPGTDRVLAWSATTVLPLVVWVGLLRFANVRGRQLEQQIDLNIPAVPLFGFIYDEPRWAHVLIPVAVGAALVALAPLAARLLAWPVLLVAAPLASTSWAAALARVDRGGGLTRGLLHEQEYLTDLPRISGDPGGFLRTFTEDIATYHVHVRGHPPGFVLLLSGLDRLGLATPGWIAALCLAGGAAAVVAVLVTARDVAGEDVARRAAPFVVLAPAVIWVATSADALYAGLAAWTAALLVLALRRTGRRADLLALGGGVLAALAVLGSYGMVLIGAVPLVVAVAERRVRPLLVGTASAVATLALLVPFGFWWPAGLAATRHEYDILPLERPFSFFVVANLAAWGLALGPATAVALARLRDRRLWLLVGGGVAAAVAADLSGLSNGEVERIWLPFTLWVLPAGAVLAVRAWPARAWLALQAATAVVIVATVRTEW